MVEKADPRQDVTPEVPVHSDGDRWWRRAVARRTTLDWLAAAVALIGLTAVLTGLLPRADAWATVRRVFPLLLFLGSVVALAELTAKAEVFSVLATRLVRGARGSYPVLFVACVLFASLTTIFLNLDTTAVLLTAVMLAAAAKSGLPGTAMAMLTVWLANTASLLLPVSNLTNLLAADRIGLDPVGLATRMVVPQVAAVVATAVCLWVFYWRRGKREQDRYQPPEPHVAADRVLFVTASVVCLAFVVLVLVGAPLEVASIACAGVLLAVVAVRDRALLSWGLLPIRLLAFVTGLFLLVQTADRLALAPLVRTLVGTDPGAAGVVRAALTGAGLSNSINNLPAYVVGEAAIPVANHDQLLGLLIGTNVGPLVAPWASLAIILWADRCRAAGVRVNWRQFAVTGVVTATVVLACAVCGLLVTG
jgi:arsenical pump membrane protein